MESMSYTDTVIATDTSRLLPNRFTDRNIAVPRDLPGVVIFLHGVNDPGASYESVETGLCQGVNERLDRRDLKAGRYGLITLRLRNFRWMNGVRMRKPPSTILTLISISATPTTPKPAA
jgi:hypothetical protein